MRTFKPNKLSITLTSLEPFYSSTLGTISAPLPAGWPYTAGLLSMQVGRQTCGVRIYPYGKTKNRWPSLQEGWEAAKGWDTFPALPECSLTPARQSSEQPRTHFQGNSSTGLFSTNHNVTGTKIIWWVLQMLKFVNKQQTCWVMRAPFVHDFGTWYSYNQLLRDLQGSRCSHACAYLYKKKKKKRVGHPPFFISSSHIVIDFYCLHTMVLCRHIMHGKTTCFNKK